MISSHLRQTIEQQSNLYQLQQYWRDRGVAQIVANPPVEGILLKFKVDGAWQGIIDLNEWFINVMPDSARLASRAFSSHLLKDLFVNCTAPFTPPHPEWAYENVEAELCDISDFHLIETCVAVSGDTGKIWIVRWPYPDEDNWLKKIKRPDISQLPITINFELGHSNIRLALLRQVEQGDVVLINHISSDAVIHSKVVGTYQKIEGNIMFTQYEETYEEESNVETENSSVLTARDSIPVQLTFILEQRTVTLAEVENMYRGDVIPYKVKQEKQVIISANGVHIAKGELIWLGENMGVEVTELFNEVSYVK